jgi:hypothetical protein
MNLKMQAVVLRSVELFVIAKAGSRNLAVYSCLSLKVEQCPEQLRMGTFPLRFTACGIKGIECYSDEVLKCRLANG